MDKKEEFWKAMSSAPIEVSCATCANRDGSRHGDSIVFKYCGMCIAPHRIDYKRRHPHDCDIVKNEIGLCDDKESWDDYWEWNGR